MEQVPVDKVEKRPYRTVLAERFREEYPDDAVDYGDDEAFFGALERYDSGRDKLIEGYAENSKRLSALFNENPQAGAFITSLMNGSDVLDAIAGSFGADFEAALKDPEARKRYDEGIADGVRTARRRRQYCVSRRRMPTCMLMRWSVFSRTRTSERWIGRILRVLSRALSIS